MPELPEVESVRRQIVTPLSGRVITAVWRDPYPSRRITRPHHAVNLQVRDVTRRGKYLLMPLLDPATGAVAKELVIHLGMTGVLTFATDDRPAEPHLRVRFTLDDDTRLLFCDPRRFGRVSVIDAGAYASIPTLYTLGPEPLAPTWDPRQFAAALKASDTPVKAALLNQRVVAGVGNIYADEALWAARIHPATRRVGASRAVALHAEIVRILTNAVAKEGTTFRNYQLTNGASGQFAASLQVYGKAGEPCPRCAAPLRRTVVAQRGTTYCPACQRW